MADVGSYCSTEFDCKPRNFCWKTDKDRPSECLEKHTAPDDIKFYWDKDNYPTETAASVLKHGLYCQSGIAKQDLVADPTGYTASCVTISKIFTASQAGIDVTDFNSNVSYPHACNPDGSTVCQYYKGTERQFELKCECGLIEGDSSKGYCPLPEESLITHNIDWLKRMWVGDNCHTYDRHNFAAQKECGIGNNYDVLNTVLNSTFNLLYHPYIQGQKISEKYTDEELAETEKIDSKFVDWTYNYYCMQKFVYNSYYNVKSLRGSAVLQSITAMASVVSLISIIN